MTDADMSLLQIVIASTPRPPCLGVHCAWAHPSLGICFVRGLLEEMHVLMLTVSVKALVKSFFFFFFLL